MPVIGLRQLHRDTREVIERLEKEGEVMVITRQGKPIAELRPVSEEQIAGYALALAPEFVASRERAEAAIQAGDGQPASEVLAEFEAEDEQDEENEFEIFQTSTEAFLRDPVIADISRQVAALSGAGAMAGAAPIQSLNATLFLTLARDSLAAAAEKVRRVNEGIVIRSGPQISVEHYVSELSRVTESERLAARTTIIPGLSDPKAE